VSDLQQPAQERNVVGPLLLGSVPEGQRALDTGGIASEVLVFLVESLEAQVSLCFCLLQAEQATHRLRQHCV
jgi:hypothetical protein